MRLLLSQAQDLLAEYVEYGMCSTDARVARGINLAIERLLPALNPEKTIGRYQFDVSDSMITCPREVKTILAASLDYTCDGNLNCAPGCRQPVQVKSKWYEMLEGGPIGWTPSPTSTATLVDMGTGFSTFADITPDNPQFIRVYADIKAPQLEAYIGVHGYDINGNYSSAYVDGNYWDYDAIPVPIATENYVDSSVAFSQIDRIIKTGITMGRTRLYALSLDKTVQTPIAIYAVDELAPDYRRYSLSWCGATIPSTVTALAKRQFVWTTDPTADLLITNVGALQNALMAMKYEKAGSYDQAAAAWKTAFQALENETRDYDGDYTPNIQMQQCWGGGDIWSLR
jgi:hypothetical protein